MKIKLFKLLTTLSLVVACYGAFAQTNVSGVSQCERQFNLCQSVQFNPRLFCGRAVQEVVRNCFIELDGPSAGSCNYGMTIGTGWHSNCNTSSRSFAVCMARGDSRQESCFANFGISNPENSPCNLEYQACLQNVDSAPFRPR